ncbi:Imm30 family immunity protein [Saccharibacillus sp. CPCC 101409]|uniref:Imm30 family immunity protein n=1 Tax=Saccharibacillus sp. CPCC 101409 TaxID=3058041 RepID=UPI0026729FB2|nr:Imm30 family immunity protein [Saccharibacillus sp. CPCC 101409]MDO3410298.1 Imm30 family immunity protein [Saccharibacillus sp. CPCC 101409]
MPDQELLDELYRMRYLDGEDDDLDRFTDILNELCESASADVIPYLCRVLEDDIIEPSAAGDLLETIFYIADRCGADESMRQLARGIPNLFPQAEGWADRLHRMLLNCDRPEQPYLEAYGAALRRIPASSVRRVVNILLEIKRNQPELYTEQVDAFMSLLIREEAGDRPACAQE